MELTILPVACCSTNDLLIDYEPVRGKHSTTAIPDNFVGPQGLHPYTNVSICSMIIFAIFGLCHGYRNPEHLPKFMNSVVNAINPVNRYGYMETPKIKVIASGYGAQLAAQRISMTTRWRHCEHVQLK